MSSENEGAAVPPAAGEQPAAPTPPAAPPTSGAASTDDFPLRPPDGEALPAGAAPSPFDPPAAAPAAPTPPAGPPAAGSALQADPTGTAQPPRSSGDTAAGQPAPTAQPAYAQQPPPATQAQAPAQASVHQPYPSPQSAQSPPPQQQSAPQPYGRPAPELPTQSSAPATAAHGAGAGGWGGGGSTYAGQGGAGQGGAGDPGAPWGAPSVLAEPSRPVKKRSPALVAIVAVAALLAGGVGGGIGFVVANNDSEDSSTVPSSSSENLDRAPDSVAGIAAKALPSVVTIQADGAQASGTGTGFVYDKQGHIMTNNHVVATAAESGDLSVTFSNGKQYDAEVVGRAEGYDIAVLKLKGAEDAKLVPLALGQSDEVQVGDVAIAIGSPYGLSGTVTTGIVSAKNRPVASSDGQSSNASYMSAIQTDASINPGNSGGPLLNADGAVIGVNSAIQPAKDETGQAQGGSVGLGFAIPVNQAKRVAETLIKTGEPVYPVIGVHVDLPGAQGKPTSEGARIADDTGETKSVTPGGPAEKAGLRSGDVITKLDGRIVDSGPTLIGEIWTHEPGDTVEITYQRDGQETTVDLVLGERKGD